RHVRDPAGGQEPGAGSPVPEPPARHQAGVQQLHLHLLPAADQRDDTRVADQAGPDPADAEDDDHPRGTVQERPGSGSALERGRSAVGERVGGGQVGLTRRSSYWRGFAVPGVVWLCLFVVVPAYAVVAMALGKVNLLLEPVPAWSPAAWNPGW